jgi:conflict system STAND superfamily ATPase
VTRDPRPPASYDLDQLGWLQFERLCSLFLEAEAGVADLVWIGHADRACAASLDRPLVLPAHCIRWPGPATLAVLWVRREGSAWARHQAFAQRLAMLVAARELAAPDDVLVLTNLDAGKAQQALTRFHPRPAPTVVVLGAGELSDSLDRRPRLRAALPSVLGLRDLGPLIDPAVGDRSSLDVSAAQALARVFSPTRAFDRARAILDRHRFVVLTGPPEMGKTAIARMIALAALTDGWEAHECERPDQVRTTFAAGRRQIFVADDAFGSTEYRPDAAEQWARELSRLLELLDDDHWLIWTSRPAPLKAALRRIQRERGSERFPAPGEVLVDAGDLDLAEKTLILFRHAKDPAAGRAIRALVRATGPQIVDHPHFTPERIRRLVTDRHAELLDLGGPDPHLDPHLDAASDPDRLEPGRVLPASGHDAPRRSRHWLELVERELATPTQAMRTSYAALASEHRSLLIAMLDVPAGLVDERELAATLRRHHPGGLTASPAELIDRLTDHFIRISPLGIGWVHPSWRDLVIDELAENTVDRRRFLAACGPHGAMLVLSAAGGAEGDRALPLLLGDTDWDCFTDRVRSLLIKLDDHDVSRLLLAVADLLGAELPPSRQAEARSFAEYVLGATRRAWDARRRTLPLLLVDAWYAANANLHDPVAAPQLAPTWVELHPGSEPLEDRAALARADDWLALVRVLTDHDPAALVELGFPLGDGPTLERLVAAAARAAAGSDENLAPTALSILERIRALAPTDASLADVVRAELILETSVHDDRWWTPADLDTPPTDEPASASHDRFTTNDVARVLRDL